MPNAALYQALSYKDNFAERSANRRMELDLAARQQQMAEGQLAQQTAAQQGVIDYVSKVSDFSQFQEQDAEKLKKLEEDQRSNIASSIRDAGGDVRRWMLTGGMTQLTDYRNAVMNSNEMKNAVTTKTNIGRWAADQQENRYIRSGVVKTNDGKEMQVSQDQAYQLYQEGKLDYLPYFGSEDNIKLPVIEMMKMVNPENPYKKGNWSTQSVAAVYESLGQSPQVAWQRAQEVSDPNNPNKTTIPFSTREFSWSNELARLKYNNYKKYGTEDFANQAYDGYHKMIYGIGKENGIAQVPFKLADGTTVNVDSKLYYLGVKEQQAAMTAAGLDLSQKTTKSGQSYFIPKNASELRFIHPLTGEIMSLDGIGAVMPTTEVVTGVNPNNDGSPMSYQRVKVLMTKDQAMASGFWMDESRLGFGTSGPTQYGAGLAQETDDVPEDEGGIQDKNWVSVQLGLFLPDDSETAAIYNKQVGLKNIDVYGQSAAGTGQYSGVNPQLRAVYNSVLSQTGSPQQALDAATKWASENIR